MSKDLSDLRQRISRLKKERDHLENLAMGTGPMLEGSLIKRYTVCGKKGCKCKEGKKHGPFLYLSKTVDGRTKMAYVPKGNWVKVGQMAARYRRFRKRRRRIREITQEIETLLDEIEAENKVDLKGVIKG